LVSATMDSTFLDSVVNNDTVSQPDIFTNNSNVAPPRIWLTAEQERDQTQSFMNDAYISNFDPLTQILLIIAFSVLILFGALGNGLVCYVVIRNTAMRTPRNIFIINLAISDLTLCLFTQPFNLMKVSLQRWDLGDFMCKFVPMIAGTNVFVSTMSITAIALDRFQVIVFPTSNNMQKLGSVVALSLIWIVSMIMASPMVIFNVTQPVELLDGIILMHVCIENANLHYEKGAYSIASMIIQYIVPIVILAFAHARICNKLRYRMVNQQPTKQKVSDFQKRKSEREAIQRQKTNLLLLLIAIVFICSWLPLNVFNIIADFGSKKLWFHLDSNRLIFPVCHLLVLCSACTNPVLYGWLNGNFRKEFQAVLCCTCCDSFKITCRCGNCLGQSPQRVMADYPRQTGMSVVVYTKANDGDASINPTVDDAEKNMNTSMTVIEQGKDHNHTDSNTNGVSNQPDNVNQDNAQEPDIQDYHYQYHA